MSSLLAFEHNKEIILIGGAPVNSCVLNELLQITQVVVAADGGYNNKLPKGITYQAVIGDMDSVCNWPIVEVLHVKDQNTTDFEKCILNIKFKTMLAVGFYGGRIDHTLSVMNDLVKHKDKRIYLIGEHDFAFVIRDTLNINLPIGTNISFIPYSRVVGIESVGLKWSLTGVYFEPGGFVSISNLTVLEDITVSFDCNEVLVILPMTVLSRVLV